MLIWETCAPSCLLQLQNIIGLILVKELVLVDEDAGVRVRDLHLREIPFIRWVVGAGGGGWVTRLGDLHLRGFPFIRWWGGMEWGGVGWSGVLLPAFMDENAGVRVRDLHLREIPFIRWVPWWLMVCARVHACTCTRFCGRK